MTLTPVDTVSWASLVLAPICSSGGHQRVGGEKSGGMFPIYPRLGQWLCFSLATAVLREPRTHSCSSPRLQESTLALLPSGLVGKSSPLLAAQVLHHLLWIPLTHTPLR